MGSGGGPATTTQRTTSSIPGWEQPYAKAYLSSLASQVFPDLQLPDNYFSKSAPNFGQGAGTGGTGVPASSGSSGTSGSGGSSGGNGDTQIASSLNPLAQQFLLGSIGGSSYLQNQAANNPNAILGASSPLALNQLASLYPNLGLS